MFTGLVDHTAEVVGIEIKAEGALLRMSTQWDNFQLGESLCVDGVCLTVSKFQGKSVAVELSPETLRVTTAGKYVIGSSVNIERSLRMGDALGGHWVTGHVDATASVAVIRTHGEFVEVIISGVDANLIVRKGSIAINGVSLTINDVVSDGISLMLIPHTLEKTNLKGLGVGGLVNIEYDYVAKLVVNQVNVWKGNR